LGQCISWLKDGLKSRAMTRDLDWGVPVPVSGGEGKVLYVWLDAPIGYISATRQWAADNGKDWKLYWQDENARLIHFIGKDNIVFHCIIFPIILKAHGGYVLPDNVPANEFLNLEGDKISTSRNHAVWLHEYLQDFPGKRDELRYVLTSIAPENGDSEFTWKDFQTRVNSELVAILGNFVNRVMVLYHKYYQGVIQSDRKAFLLKANHDAVGKAYDSLAENIEQYKFRQALFEVMDLARYGNKYLTENEPWKRFATEPEQAEQTLTECLLLIAHLGICLQPFLPDTAEKIFTMLNLGKTSFGWHEPVELHKGHTLNAPRLLFEKVEDAAIEQQIEKLRKAKMENTSVTVELNELLPAKAEIVYDDFAKMDIRVGTILEAQKVPKADKLLQLTIDTGLDKRTVVSGIAEYYQPEEIIGKQVAILVNLAPRKIRGIESQGMILMAKDNQGKLHFVRPENIINPGADIS
jgi:methionyl-tRNA synthetase